MTRQQCLLFRQFPADSFVSHLLQESTLFSGDEVFNDPFLYSSSSQDSPLSCPFLVLFLNVYFCISPIRPSALSGWW